MRQQRLFTPEPKTALATVEPTQAAHVLTCSFWERTNPKPVVKFVALRKIVQTFLDAGWSPAAIDRALSETRAFTTGAIEYTLRCRTEQAKPKSFDALQRRMAQHQAAQA